MDSAVVIFKIFLAHVFHYFVCLHQNALGVGLFGDGGNFYHRDGGNCFWLCAARGAACV